MRDPGRDGDQGAVSARDYVQKFAAYLGYLTGGGFSRDYEGFPTILVVTKDRTAEERRSGSLRQLTPPVVRGIAIPLLISWSWRIFHDPGNPGGPLGPIWREHGILARRNWPVGSESASVVSRSWHQCVSAPPGMGPGFRTGCSEEGRGA